MRRYRLKNACGGERVTAKEMVNLSKTKSFVFGTKTGGHEMTGYQASQAMRRLETAVREQKGVKAMAQASGDHLAVVMTISVRFAK